MSNSDAAQYVLRYNEITGDLEAQVGLNWQTLLLANSGGINQLTGDVTAGPGTGSQAATLKTVNSNVGSFTSANITVNAKGLITAASNGSGGASFTPAAQFQTTTPGAFITSSTFTNTNVTIAFAMADATHKVKVSVSGGLYIDTTTAHITLAVDGTNIGPATGLNVMDQQSFTNAGAQDVPTSFTVLYSPGDTASHTYTVQLANENNSSQMLFPSNSAGTIVIEEIL